MAIRSIVEVPDPRLREISKPVEGVDDELRALVADMFETMYDAPGIGLAAIQVGVPKRVLVIDLQEPEEEDGEPVKDPRVFINPEILTTSDHDVPYTEGCLSVPDQFAEVDRPDRIRARQRRSHRHPLHLQRRPRCPRRRHHLDRRQRHQRGHHRAGEGRQLERAGTDLRHHVVVAAELVVREQLDRHL